MKQVSLETYTNKLACPVEPPYLSSLSYHLNLQANQQHQRKMHQNFLLQPMLTRICYLQLFEGDHLGTRSKFCHHAKHHQTIDEIF